MLRIISLIIKAVFVAYLIIFSVSNVNTVTFKPLMNVVTYNIPLFLLVIITLFIGIVIGALAVWGENMSLKSKMRKLNKEIKNEQQEIERLQKLTISQEPVKTEENKQEQTAEEKPAAAAVQNDIKDALR
ncbi:MAG: LapA family protein [Candidatus Mucispirillum faecigallinarum]|uniref:LapA family protein n=1 Tax=Candidatus Mucispirillum faecigallinarum TaxID=2838699 RepID=A0A9D2GUD1_9BACT|nr:LapA family protein [Mucispirillum sp.]MDY5051651.1 LapA family protein [Candidatus Mucispirillum faecigallinarum]HIZ90178.1 LapA family protein [Candidatus Mucispirillum faecigallinarum]